MSENDVVDGRYYEVAKPASLAERIIIQARDRIYDDFLAIMQPQPSDRILDVGVSDVVNDAANMLERKYAHPQNITAAGLGSGGDFSAAFPQVAYRQIIANQRLPFEDGAFDIAVSNAVIEHVGSPANQAFFVSELMRVARRVFITAPNRHFPVEHHTAVPLLHFWPATFSLACAALNKRDWLDPENLILVGKRELDALRPKDRDCRSGYTGLALGPFSSNLYLGIL